VGERPSEWVSSSREAEVLQAPRDAHGPAAVAEMPPDLPQDRRDGERGEAAPLRVEPVDGVEQADRADLDEVVVGLPATPEALGEVVDERKLVLHHLLSEGGPARLVVGEPRKLREEMLDAAAGRRRVPRRSLTAHAHR